MSEFLTSACRFLCLQCSWIKRLYDDSFHEWKVMPLHLISKHFDKSFFFHSNFFFKKKLIKSFSPFYKKILLNVKATFLNHQEPLPVFCLKRKIHYPFKWIQLIEWSNYLNMNSRLHLSNKLKKCGNFLWISYPADTRCHCNIIRRLYDDKASYKQL